MKSFKEIRNLSEKMRMPKAPFKGMHLTGFEGKFKLQQQSMHDDNVSPAVIKDVKAGLKIVEKHLKKQGMRYKEEEVLIGPMDVAKKEKLKPGEGATDFAIDLFPGFPGKNPDLPRGKVTGDVNLDDMVKELGKLKSFGNFRNDFSDNWGEPGKD
jgi:hypothetical protein